MTHTAPHDTHYTISDLAREFGVTARAIRFYEDQGLLHPSRDGRKRVFSAADRARLRLILRGKRVGFSLAEIKEMLDLEALGAGGKAHIEDALRRFRERIAALRVQRRDITASIEELEAGCTWMEERLADRDPPEDLKRSARAFEALARARLETPPRANTG